MTKQYIKNTNIESSFVDTKLNIVDAFSNLVTNTIHTMFLDFFHSDFNALIIQTLQSKKL